MPKFSDSSYKILKDYFDVIKAERTDDDNAYLLGQNRTIVSEGGIYTKLYQQNEAGDFIGHRFIIQDISGNNFKFFYTGLESQHSGATALEVGEKMYFRKDSFFHDWLINNPNASVNFEDFVSINKSFLYFGEILQITDSTQEYNIEFRGLKDWVMESLPEHNRTDNLTDFMEVYWDRVYHQIYNLTKNLWTMIDPKEVKIDHLDYLATRANISTDKDKIGGLILREWVDQLLYWLKRKGTYTSWIAVYKMILGGTRNKLNIFEKWCEWCLFELRRSENWLVDNDFDEHHIIEYYNPSGGLPSGGAGIEYYGKYQVGDYPVHATEAPNALASGGCFATRYMCGDLVDFPVDWGNIIDEQAVLEYDNYSLLINGFDPSLDDVSNLAFYGPTTVSGGSNNNELRHCLRVYIDSQSQPSGGIVIWGATDNPQEEFSAGDRSINREWVGLTAEVHGRLPATAAPVFRLIESVPSGANVTATTVPFQKDETYYVVVEKKDDILYANFFDTPSHKSTELAEQISLPLRGAHVGKAGWNTIYGLGTIRESATMPSASFVGEVSYFRESAGQITTLGPTGYKVITPHIRVELDLSTEPMGEDFIISQDQAEELVRYWEYLKPVSKFVEYNWLLSPIGNISEAGEAIPLYPVDDTAFCDTQFVGQAWVSAATPTSASKGPDGDWYDYTYKEQLLVASDEWTVTHGLDSKELIIQSYDKDDRQIWPINHTFLSENRVALDWVGNKRGKVIIAGLKDWNYSHLQTKPTTAWSIEHNQGVSGANSINFEIVSISGSPGIVDFTTTNYLDTHFNMGPEYGMLSYFGTSAWSVSGGWTYDSAKNIYTITGPTEGVQYAVLEPGDWANTGWATSNQEGLRTGKVRVTFTTSGAPTPSASWVLNGNWLRRELIPNLIEDYSLSSEYTLAGAEASARLTRADAPQSVIYYDALRVTDEAYAYKDFGVDGIGDFEILFVHKFRGSGLGPYVGVFCMANSINDFSGLGYTTNDGIFIYCTEGASTTTYYGYANGNGMTNAGGSGPITLQYSGVYEPNQGPMYNRIKRVGSDIRMWVYKDPRDGRNPFVARENYFTYSGWPASGAFLGSTDTKFRYFYPIQSFDSGSSPNSMSGYVSGAQWTYLEDTWATSGDYKYLEWEEIAVSDADGNSGELVYTADTTDWWYDTPGDIHNLRFAFRPTYTNTSGASGGDFYFAEYGQNNDFGVISPTASNYFDYVPEYSNFTDTADAVDGSRSSFATTNAVTESGIVAHTVTIASDDLLYQGRSDDLADFPVKIHLSDKCGKNGVNMGKVFTKIGGNYNKFRVYDDNDTNLWCEVEHWDATTSGATVWARIPNITAGVDKVLRLEFNPNRDDNPRIGLTGSSEAANVWDKDFAYVYHMNQTPVSGTACILNSVVASGGDLTPYTYRATQEDQRNFQIINHRDNRDGGWSYESSGGYALKFHGDRPYDAIGQLETNSAFDPLNENQINIEAFFKIDEVPAGTEDDWILSGVHTDGANVVYGFYVDDVGEWITGQVWVNGASEAVGAPAVTTKGPGNWIYTNFKWADDGIGQGAGIMLNTNYGDDGYHITSGGTPRNGIIDRGSNDLIIGGMNQGTAYPQRRFNGLIGETRYSRIARNNTYGIATAKTLEDRLLTFETIPDSSITLAFHISAGQAPSAQELPINSVEMLIEADGSSNAQWTPWFSDSASGDTRTYPSGGTTQLYDITSDTNAPSPWTWDDIQTLRAQIDFVPGVSADYFNVTQGDVVVTYRSTDVSNLLDGVNTTYVSAGSTSNASIMLSGATVSASGFPDNVDKVEIRTFGKLVPQAGDWNNTDFSEYSVGTSATDWTKYWDTRNFVIDTELVNSENMLKIDITDTNKRAAVGWDDVGSLADVEILSKVRWPVAATVYGIGPACRLSGVGGSENGYIVFVRDGANEIELYRYVGGASTSLDSWVYVGGFDEDTDYWVRFVAIGNRLFVRAWADGEAEPTTWGIDYTDPSPYLTAGAAGVGTYTQDGYCGEFYARAAVSGGAGNANIQLIPYFAETSGSKIDITDDISSTEDYTPWYRIDNDPQAFAEWTPDNLATFATQIKWYPNGELTDLLLSEFDVRLTNTFIDRTSTPITYQLRNIEFEKTAPSANRITITNMPRKAGSYTFLGDYGLGSEAEFWFDFAITSAGYGNILEGGELVLFTMTSYEDADGGSFAEITQAPSATAIALRAMNTSGSMHLVISEYSASGDQIDNKWDVGNSAYGTSTSIDHLYVKVNRYASYGESTQPAFVVRYYNDPERLVGDRVASQVHYLNWPYGRWGGTLAGDNIYTMLAASAVQPGLGGFGEDITSGGFDTADTSASIYYDTYSALGSDWATNPENMTDGDTTTFAQTTVDAEQVLTANTATNLNADIYNVKMRHHGIAHFKPDEWNLELYFNNTAPDDALDLTNWTEIDANSEISITTSRITFTALTENANSYVYYDFGENYFGDGAEIEIAHRASAYSGSTPAGGFFWGLTNSVGTRDDLNTAGTGVGFDCYVQDVASGFVVAQLIDFNTSQTNTTLVNNPIVAVTYYFTLYLENGNLRIVQWTDSSRTIQNDWATITNIGESGFRYFCFSNVGTGASDTVTGYIEDFDIINRGDAGKTVYDLVSQHQHSNNTIYTSAGEGHAYVYGIKPGKRARKAGDGVTNRDKPGTTNVRYTCFDSQGNFWMGMVNNSSFPSGLDGEQCGIILKCNGQSGTILQRYEPSAAKYDDAQILNDVYPGRWPSLNPAGDWRPGGLFWNPTTNCIGHVYETATASPTYRIIEYSIGNGDYPQQLKVEKDLLLTGHSWDSYESANCAAYEPTTDSYLIGTFQSAGHPWYSFNATTGAFQAKRTIRYSNGAYGVTTSGGLAILYESYATGYPYIIYVDPVTLGAADPTQYNVSPSAIRLDYKGTGYEYGDCSVNPVNGRIYAGTTGQYECQQKQTRNQLVENTDADWSEWIDITNDPLAPETWNWNHVIDLDIINHYEESNHASANRDIVRSSKVELQVGYIAETATGSGPGASGYFNSYDAGTAWPSFPEYMVDGSMGTLANASFAPYTQICDGHNVTTDGNNITKVEVRVWGSSFGTPTAWVVQPYFNGSTNGDTYDLINTYNIPYGGGPAQGWSDWIDITNDSQAPATWTWTDLTNLDIKNTWTNNAGDGPGDVVWCGVIQLRVETATESTFEYQTAPFNNPSWDGKGIPYDYTDNTYWTAAQSNFWTWETTGWGGDERSTGLQFALWDDDENTIALDNWTYTSGEQVTISYVEPNDINELFLNAPPNEGKQFYVSNIEFYDGGWEQHLDDSDWGSNGGTWNSTEQRWDAAYSVPGSAYYINLSELGTWVNSYRPTQVRLTWGYLGGNTTSTSGWQPLNAIGTWAENYRPVRARINFTGPGDPWDKIRLKDSLGNVLSSASNFQNGENLVINNWYGADIKTLEVSADSGPWNITNIEFLTSGSQVNTVTGYIHNMQQQYEDNARLIIPSQAIQVSPDVMRVEFSEPTDGRCFIRDDDYYHEQLTPATTWDINHGLNSFAQIVQCYDHNKRWVFPEEIVLETRNKTVCTFAEPVSGTASIILFGSSINYDETTALFGDPDLGVKGYWKIGEGGDNPYFDPQKANDINTILTSGGITSQTETSTAASGTILVTFEVPADGAYTINEFGVYDRDRNLHYYTRNSSLHKPDGVELHVIYRIRKE